MTGAVVLCFVENYLKAHKDIAMPEKTFLETMAPKLGPSVLMNMNNAQLVAIRELLIRNGTFTREAMTAETEVQLGNIANAFAKMPIPSPFQPNK